MFHASLYILICIITTSTKGEMCVEGITPNYGSILPRDPYVQMGEDITLTCQLDNETALNKNWNASYIIWKVNNTKLSPNHIKVINRLKSSLNLISVNKDQSGYYFCIVNDHNICQSIVSIIDAYPEPENVTIVCPNFKTLIITWFLTKTKIASSFKIEYTRYNDYVGTKSDGYENAKCLDGLISGKLKCWSEFTKAIFMIEHKYQISIITSNQFGNKSWVYPEIFYPKTKVKLNPPKITDIYASNSSTIVLEWTTDFLEQQLQCDYDVFYQSEWENTWKNISSTTNNKSHKIILPQLYPNSRYHIKIRIYYSTSEYYSEFSERMLSTPKEVPLMTPNITSGMFEIILLNSTDNQKLLVYWQDIPFQYNGGDLLFYRVTFESDTENETLTTNHSLAEVILPRKAYNVTIVAVNEIGSANQKSCIHIPPNDKLLKNVDLDFLYYSYTKGLMNITWHQTFYDPYLQITIYRCESDSKYTCLGSLHWSTVSLDVPGWSFNIENNKYYQVGTSVDGNMMSSGIKWWSECAVNFDQDSIGDIPFIHMKTSSSLWLNWTATCRQRSFVRQYIFKYCRLLKPGENCPENKEEERIAGPQDTEIILKNLKPYSIYLITLKVVFINLSETFIGSYHLETEASAPEDCPQNIKIVRHNETNILLNWSPPERPNGQISEYIIILKSDIETNFSTNMTNFEVGNLRSNKIYSIEMRACTKKDNPTFCSEWTKPLAVPTSIVDKYDLIIGMTFFGGLVFTLLLVLFLCLILRARDQMKLPEVCLPIEIAGQVPLYNHKFCQESTQKRNLNRGNTITSTNISHCITSETIKEESDIILKKSLDLSDEIQRKPFKCIRTEMYSSHMPSSIKMPKIPSLGNSESESLLLTAITLNSTDYLQSCNYKPKDSVVTLNFKLSNGDIKIKTSNESKNGELPNSWTEPEIDSYSQVTLGSKSYQSQDFFHNGLVDSSTKENSRVSKATDETVQYPYEFNDNDKYSDSVKHSSTKKCSNDFKTMNLIQKPLNLKKQLNYLPQSSLDYLHNYSPENKTGSSKNGYSKFTIIDSGYVIKDVVNEHL